MQTHEQDKSGIRAHDERSRAHDTSSIYINVAVLTCSLGTAAERTLSYVSIYDCFNFTQTDEQRRIRLILTPQIQPLKSAIAQPYVLSFKCTFVQFYWQAALRSKNAFVLWLQPGGAVHAPSTICPTSTPDEAVPCPHMVFQPSPAPRPLV